MQIKQSIDQIFSSLINSSVITLKMPDTLKVNDDVLLTRRYSLNSKLNANRALDPRIEV